MRLEACYWIYTIDREIIEGGKNGAGTERRRADSGFGENLCRRKSESRISFFGILIFGKGKSRPPSGPVLTLHGEKRRAMLYLSFLSSICPGQSSRFSPY